MAWQRTIRNPVGTSGVGIHGGEQVNLTLRPAPAGTGIIFVRKDLGIAIPARAENARDQSYATTLNVRGAKARTVEHLMAALAGVGVTNVFVDIDGAEVPILDGSALPFIADAASGRVLRAGAQHPRDAGEKADLGRGLASAGSRCAPAPSCRWTTG